MGDNMTSARKNVVVKILICSIGLMLLWLLVEALLPANVVLPRAFHFTLVFMLMIAMIVVRVVGGTAKLRNKAAHSLEIKEMQREVDKTVRRYMSLLEGAGNAIYVFNADDGILEEVNRRGTEL